MNNHQHQYHYHHNHNHHRRDTYEYVERESAITMSNHDQRRVYDRSLYARFNGPDCKFRFDKTTLRAYDVDTTRLVTGSNEETTTTASDGDSIESSSSSVSSVWSSLSSFSSSSSSFNTRNTPTNATMDLASSSSSIAAANTTTTINNNNNDNNNNKNNNNNNSSNNNNTFRIPEGTDLRYLSAIIESRVNECIRRIYARHRVRRRFRSGEIRSSRVRGDNEERSRYENHNCGGDDNNNNNNNNDKRRLSNSSGDLNISDDLADIPLRSNDKTRILVRGLNRGLAYLDRRLRRALNGLPDKSSAYYRILAKLKRTVTYLRVPIYTAMTILGVYTSVAHVLAPDDSGTLIFSAALYHILNGSKVLGYT